MKRLLLFLMITPLTLGMNAQLTGLTVETVVEHTGMVGTTDLTGYTTYRIWGNFTNENDFCSAVYGLAGEPLEITTTTDFWQSGLGGSTGPAIIPAVVVAFPEVEFDSWVTIGRENSEDPGNDINALQTGGEPWVDVFEAGGDVVINGAIGGSWFTTFGDMAVAPNGYAGADLQILLGQFTTTGDISGFMNIQVFVDGDQGNDAVAVGMPFSSVEGTIFGCTDPDADNYDAAANTDDGSCVYPCAIIIDEIVINSMPDCPGESTASITVVASGQQGGSFYQLDGENMVAVSTFNNLAGGMHTIVATDSQGCSATLEFEIPEPDPIEVVISLESGISCNGEIDAVIGGTISGGTGAYSFSLNDDMSDPVSDLNFADLGPGTYTVYVTDENGCMGESTSLSITQPTAVQVSITGSDDATCADTNDGTLVGNGIGGTGAITFSIDGVNYQAGSTFDNLAPGTYFLYGQDANGCTDESNVSVTIEAPEEIMLNEMVEGVSCFGDTNGMISVAATGGNGGIEYSFDGGEFDGEVSEWMDLAPGDYTVVAMDNGACDLEMVLTITEPAELIATLDPNNISCNGEGDGQIIVDAAGGTMAYMYQMDGGTMTNDNVFGDLEAGTYTITVTDANGCMTESITDITEPDALDVTIDDVVASSGNDGSIDVTATGGTGSLNFEWTGPNGFTSSDEDLTGLEAGMYNLTVTDENDCMFEVSGGIEVTVGIGELDAQVLLSVSPNPSNGQFFVNVDGLNGQKVSIRVTDVQGRTLINRDLNQSTGQFIELLDLSGAADGFYFMTLTVGTYVSTTKLVKQF